MKKLWQWLSGKKTVIGATGLLIINSDFIAAFFANPDAQFMNPNLYILAQGIAASFFTVGLLHKAVKPKSK